MLYLELQTVGSLSKSLPKSSLLSFSDMNSTECAAQGHWPSKASKPLSLHLVVKHTANRVVVWEIFSKDVEVAQGRNIADACKAAGVSHFIWSSLAHAGKGTA